MWAVSITTSTLPHFVSLPPGDHNLLHILLLLLHLPSQGRPPLPLSEITVCQLPAYQGRVLRIKPLPLRGSRRRCALCVNTFHRIAASLSGSVFRNRVGFSFGGVERFEAAGRGPLPGALIGTGAAGRASPGPAMMEIALRSLMARSEALGRVAYRRVLINTRSCLFGRAGIKTF